MYRLVGRSLPAEGSEKLSKRISYLFASKGVSDVPPCTVKRRVVGAIPPRGYPTGLSFSAQLGESDCLEPIACEGSSLGDRCFKLLRYLVEINAKFRFENVGGDAAAGFVSLIENAEEQMCRVDL